MQSDQLATDNDLDTVLGQPLKNIPNMHAEVDRNDISDNETPRQDNAGQFKENRSVTMNIFGKKIVPF